MAMSLRYESPITGQVDDEEECPECGEELDELGLCPNGCLDEADGFMDDGERDGSDRDW